MLKIVNVGLGLILLLISILMLTKDDFAPNPHLVFLVISLLCLSSGIQELKEGRKNTGYIFFFIVLVSFSLYISLFRNNLF